MGQLAKEEFISNAPQCIVSITFPSLWPLHKCYWDSSLLIYHYTMTLAYCYCATDKSHSIRLNVRKQLPWNVKLSNVPCDNLNPLYIFNQNAVASWKAAHLKKVSMHHCCFFLKITSKHISMIISHYGGLKHIKSSTARVDYQFFLSDRLYELSSSEWT